MAIKKHVHNVGLELVEDRKPSISATPADVMYS
jgi:hypothetical protein